MAVVLIAPGSLLGQTDGSVAFSVTTSNPGHEYDPRNIMAIWVTTDSGGFVKTLKKRAASRQQYLYQWIAGTGQNTVDAITGATLNSHQTHNVTWDCRNTSGAVVADGVYEIRVELTGKNGQGPYTPANHIQFIKGAAPATVNPGNTSIFSSMQVDYTPSGTPHDIAVSEIDVPSYVLSGSNVSVTVTIDNETATLETNITVELRNTTSDVSAGTNTILTLPASSSVQTVFTWNTAGLQHGDYDLTATAAPVPDEGATADNELTETVTVRGPQHDIAATTIDVATRVTPGTTPNITVAVTNNGDFTEAFDVVLTDLTASSATMTQTVSSLASGAGQNVVFPWNTAGLIHGSHHLKAIAGPLSTEWNLANNVLYAWTAIATGVVDRTLIAAGSWWEYNDQGVDLHASNWKESTYYSSLWGGGLAQLGYSEGDENTLLSYGGDSNNKYPCYYFRTEFVAAAVPETLNAELLRDDGAVVYINGREAIRENMESGPTSYDQYASGNAVGGTDEDTFWPFALDPSLVVPGINVVAVELHQKNATSSDISFDFELTATMPAWLDQPDVTVTDVSLHDGIAGDVVAVDAAVMNLGNVPATFSVSLSNLDGGAGDGPGTINDLMPGETEHVHFSWRTMGLSPGDYRLETAVSGVIGDINSSNDSLVATGTVVSTGFAHEAARVEGSIGGFCEDIVTDGNTAYLVAGASLVALDLSSPSVPGVLDALHLTGLGSDIEVAAQHAYVACGKDGVQVVDVSSPTSMVYRLTIATSGHAHDVGVAGNTLYVADGARGLRIVDITSPSAPALLGTVLTGGAAYAVTVSGTIAYIADDEGVLILDVSTPAAPSEQGRVSGIGFGRALYLDGTTLYVGDANSELHIADVGTPASASILGSIRLSGPVRDVTLSGSHLYAAVGSAGIDVVDVSSPASPSNTASIVTADEATGVAWLGTDLCVSDGFAGMRIIEAPAGEASVAGVFTDVSRSRASASRDGYAFLAAGNQGIRIYDVSSSDSPVLAGTSLFATNARDVALGGSSLFVADGQYGLAVLDVTTPAVPAGLGRYLSGELGSVRRVAVSGSAVVITDGRRVERLDVTALSSPAFTHAYTPGGFTYEMAWSGDYVFLAGGRSGLVVLSSSNLAEEAVLPLPGVALDLSVDGTNAFVAAGDFGWHVIDLSTPSSPSLARTETAYGITHGIASAGSLLHTATRGRTVETVNISTPLTPVAFTNFGPLVHAMQISAEGPLAFASEDEGGLAILAAAIPDDTDGDGLSDSWEQSIVDAEADDGIDSIEDVLPGDDFDGDGHTNIEEWYAGTDATDSGSVFASSVSAGAGDSEFVVRWHSVEGQTYTLHKSTNLLDGFTPLLSDIPATPPMNVYTDTVSTAHAFYSVTTYR